MTLIILYGILAIGSGILTATYLWSSGPFIALSAAILVGAIAIVGVAVVSFMTSRQRAPDQAPAYRETSGEADSSRIR